MPRNQARLHSIWRGRIQVHPIFVTHFSATGGSYRANSIRICYFGRVCAFVIAHFTRGGD
jgi:hypothetical protein